MSTHHADTDVIDAKKRVQQVVDFVHGGMVNGWTERYVPYTMIASKLGVLIGDVSMACKHFRGASCSSFFVVVGEQE